MIVPDQGYHFGAFKLTYFDLGKLQTRFSPQTRLTRCYPYIVLSHVSTPRHRLSPQSSAIFQTFARSIFSPEPRLFVETDVVWFRLTEAETDSLASGVIAPKAALGPILLEDLCLQCAKGLKLLFSLCGGCSKWCKVSQSNRAHRSRIAHAAPLQIWQSGNPLKVP